MVASHWLSCSPGDEESVSSSRWKSRSIRVRGQAHHFLLGLQLTRSVGAKISHLHFSEAFRHYVS